jgi:hypothetical protein
MKERIHEYCHQLHLPVMAERWSAMAEYASTHNISYSEFLFRLLEAETSKNRNDRSKRSSSCPNCRIARRSIRLILPRSLRWMSAGFESCLPCRLLIERRIFFFSVRRGLERRTWRFRLEWRRSQEDIKRILLPLTIWSIS